MNRLLPLVAAVLVLGCVRSPNVAKQMCDLIESGEDLGPEYLRWDPKPDERETLLKLLVEHAEVSDGSPSEEGAVCFFRSEDDRAHVVYRTLEGESRIQSFAEYEGQWSIEYGQEQAIWRVD